MGGMEWTVVGFAVTLGVLCLMEEACSEAKS